MRKPVHHRDHAGAPAPSTPAAQAVAAVAARPLSFARDIRPMFEPFAAAMMWRFDLTDYTAVMANASTITGRIADGGGMPPPPFPPLTAAQVQQFKDWVSQGCNP
ncbi:MAG TPA: hypothetical protein VFP84_38120 [Kofleriaceae bacterium]|nr:hypothetical protein [Kofleriaceae bacterium]